MSWLSIVPLRQLTCFSDVKNATRLFWGAAQLSVSGSEWHTWKLDGATAADVAQPHVSITSNAIYDGSLSSCHHPSPSRHSHLELRRMLGSTCNVVGWVMAESGCLLLVLLIIVLSVDSVLITN